MFYRALFCLDNSKSCQGIVMDFWWVRCMTGKNWLDFGGDSAHVTTGLGYSCLGEACAV